MKAGIRTIDGDTGGDSGGVEKAVFRHSALVRPRGHVESCPGAKRFVRHAFSASSKFACLPAAQRVCNDGTNASPIPSPLQCLAQFNSAYTLCLPLTIAAGPEALTLVNNLLRLPTSILCSFGLFAGLSVGRSQAISSTDAWDVTQGATITAYSGWSSFTSQNTLPNIFGTHVPVLHPATLVPWPGEEDAGFFGEGMPAGFVHWIEWSTPAAVDLVGYRLSANAAAFMGYEGVRGFSMFKLYVRDASTLDFELVDSFAPATPNYYETFSRTFPTVTGTDFRAEFLQYAPPESIAPGPRIRELDAVTVPEPGTVGVAAAVALLGFGLWRRRGSATTA